jgi:hypothetical protein
MRRTSNIKATLTQSHCHRIRETFRSSSTCVRTTRHHAISSPPLLEPANLKHQQNATNGSTSTTSETQLLKNGTNYQIKHRSRLATRLVPYASMLLLESSTMPSHSTPRSAAAINVNFADMRNLRQFHWLHFAAERPELSPRVNV